MIVNRPRGLASACSVVSIAIALTVASGCNLILDNEKRSLSRRVVDSNVANDAEVPDSSVDGSEQDSGPTPETRRCGGDPFPQCAPNAIDMGTEACGGCGAGTRTRQRGCTIDCRWASWSAWSDCVEPAEICKPGDTQEKMEACGNCNLGMRKTTRSCTSTCGWSDWNPEACIVDESTCAPGTVWPLTEIGCGAMCGRSTQTRTCNASCAWDPVVTGMCMSEGVCKPGETRMAAPAGCNENYCNKGVQQRTETCTQSCTWGTPTAIGTCAIPTNVCRPTDLGAATGWRCRPNDPGYREVCNGSTVGAAACTWSSREAYSGC